MFDWVKNLVSKREFRKWVVDDTRGGYSIGDRFISRSDVVEIVAFKRDLLTIDQLCIGIGVGEPDEDGELEREFIEEDNPSYRSVLDDIEAHFQLKEGWWDDVVQPAFATNWAVIWSGNS